MSRVNTNQQFESQIQEDTNLSDLTHPSSSPHAQLLSAYEAGASRVRVAALSELLNIGDEETIYMVCNVGLRDSEAHVRTCAALLLSGNHKPEVTAGLIERLHDEDPRVRWAGLKALAGTTDKKALQAIISYGLTDTDEIIRSTAVESLIASQATGQVLQGKDIPNIAAQIERSLVNQTATS